MKKQIRMGVVIDPIASLNPKKDTTLRLMGEAQNRGIGLYIVEIPDLFLKEGQAFGKVRTIQFLDTTSPIPAWRLGETQEMPLNDFDVILMRKDPPQDMDYLYATYILEHAESKGTLILNRPQSLRDANEKMFATWFPQCMPPTVVSANAEILKDFMAAQGVSVIKPLNGMAGQSVFKCVPNDPNLSVILETLTVYGKRHCMAQRFIPEITHGDKRIFMIDGNPFPYALARVPRENEFRGNLAAGAIGKSVALSKNDEQICQTVGPILRDKGLFLVGLDVIGDYLTEINVTSPTCVKELEADLNLNIAAVILDALLAKKGDLK